MEILSEMTDSYFGNNKLKRKRLLVSESGSIPRNSSLRNNYYLDYEDEDELEVESRPRDSSGNLEDSNCSTTSSNSYCSNISSFSAASFSSTQPFKKMTRSRKNHHKILITEEKMAEALRELQIELSKVDEMKVENKVDRWNDKNRVVINDLDREFSDGEEDEEDEGEDTLIVSDEVKKSLRKMDKEDNELKMLLTRLNQSSSSDDLKWRQMQIVPYVECSMSMKEKEDLETSLVDEANGMMDSDASSSNSSKNLNERKTTYKVDEPNEVKYGKNTLKRTFSQLSKLTIEELSPSLKHCEKSAPQFYLVDFDEDLKQPCTTDFREHDVNFNLNYNYFDKSRPKSASSVQITELDNNSDSVGEAMEL